MIIKLNRTQIFIFLLIFLIIILFFYAYFYRKSIKRAEKKFDKKKEDLEKSIKKEYNNEFRKWKNEFEEKIREDAIKRSDFSLTGKVAENLAPLTKHFDHDLKNLRYLGTPVDYIAFDNYGKKGKEEIYFIEVKSRNSRLTKNQKELKNAVRNNEVYWETVKIG